ncbi:methyltransferase 24, partial [Brachionus plicatilis]
EVKVKEKTNDISSQINSDNYFQQIRVRDFMFYKCKNIRRIGGKPKSVKNAPDNLWRIDGAWYICMDTNANPEKSNCHVLSLGINHDYTFDEEMRYSFDCSVFSFDPFVESDKFKKIRESSPSLNNSIVLKVDNKWSFYRVGIVGKTNEQKTLENLRIKDLIDLDNILDLTNLRNKVIDVFKMDIEGPEKGVFNNLDMEYACKYIKNLIFETHKNSKFVDLVKLEECFRLFWRSTRFFAGDSNGPTGHLTEFQSPKGWKLEIKQFKNELNLAEFMFTTGELYFVNINFL